MTYFLGDASGSDSDEDKGDLYTFVELTPDQANEFVMCWYLSVFVFSILINCLRVGFISLVAPGCAQDEIKGGKWYRYLCMGLFIP